MSAPPFLAASAATDRPTLDDRSFEASQRRTARIAGALYLAIFVLGPFVYFYVPGELFHDDAATTAAEISAHTGLFTAGMVAETVIIGIEIALAGLLWQLFRPVSQALALSSSLARVGEAFIQAVGVLLAGAVLLVVDRGALSGFDAGERDEVVGFLVDAMSFGVMVWGLLFGLHLLLLGVLVRRSELMPRWIGSLLLLKVATLFPQVPFMTFHMNWRIFVAAFAFATLFGVLSGVWPAWKMAKQHPVIALKGGTS